MNAKHLIVFTAILGTAAMHSLQKRDWVEPVNSKLCDTLNRECTRELANIGTLLKSGEFTSLVTNGTLNTDCSAARVDFINQCFQSASDICISNVAVDLILWKKVYSYICKHGQAFIDAESCLTSGVFSRARNLCGVGKGRWPYLSEANCNNAPPCVRNEVTKSKRCTTADANLFAGLVTEEYTLHMDRCYVRME